MKQSRGGGMSTSSMRLELWEWRRRRAWEWHEQGGRHKDIAQALGVSTGAVSQWLKRGRASGVEALRTRPRSGRPPKLTVEQRARLPELLARGAEAFGFRGEVWTANRIAEVIGRTFGVRVHRDHVSRVVRRAGWRPH